MYTDCIFHIKYYNITITFLVKNYAKKKNNIVQVVNNI